MDLREFYSIVQADDRLTGHSIDGQLARVQVGSAGDVTEYAADTIEANDWDVLRAVALGERNPEVLHHITRVVGYYSQTRNWNESKIGELADRKRGVYGVDHG